MNFPSIQWLLLIHFIHIPLPWPSPPTSRGLLWCPNARDVIVRTCMGPPLSWTCLNPEGILNRCPNHLNMEKQLRTESPLNGGVPQSGLCFRVELYSMRHKGEPYVLRWRVPLSKWYFLWMWLICLVASFFFVFEFPDTKSCLLSSQLKGTERCCKDTRLLHPCYRSKLSTAEKNLHCHQLFGGVITE